jgi:hypothetical protein
MTLTGSYVQDREDFPGFWENDVPQYLQMRESAERKVSNTLKSIKHRQEEERDVRGNQ